MANLNNLKRCWKCNNCKQIINIQKIILKAVVTASIKGEAADAEAQVWNDQLKAFPCTDAQCQLPREA